MGPRALLYMFILSLAAFTTQISGLTDAEKQALIEHLDIDSPEVQIDIAEPNPNDRPLPIKIGGPRDPNLHLADRNPVSRDENKHIGGREHKPTRVDLTDLDHSLPTLPPMVADLPVSNSWAQRLLPILLSALIYVWNSGIVGKLIIVGGSTFIIWQILRFTRSTILSIQSSAAWLSSCISPRVLPRITSNNSLASQASEKTLYRDIV